MDPLHAITLATVRSALRQLAADRTPGDSPLCQLAIVRQSLRRSGYRPTAEACAFELGRLVAEIVEAELARLRRRATRRVAGPPGDERALLRADFAADHHELEAWSALYHVYLRPDLGVDLSALAACIDDRHRRTLQRRLRHGVESLTARLRALEHDALSAARHARVRAHLPAPEATRLFGVDGMVSRVANGLIDGGARRIVALGGPGGIGKSAVARAVAERCLLSGVFDAVAWADAASLGPRGVVEAVQGPSAGHGTPRPAPYAGALAVLAADGKRVAERSVPGPPDPGAGGRLVVVDGVDDAALARAAVAAAHAADGATQVLLTGRVGWWRLTGVRVVQVPPLPPGPALELLRHVAAERGLESLALAGTEGLAPLVAATAGHPVAIQAAVGELCAADPATVAEAFAAASGVAAELCERLWADTWDRAGPDARSTVREILAGRLAEVGVDGIRHAVDAGLLIPCGGAGGARFRSPPWLRRFVARRDRERNREAVGGSSAWDASGTAGG
ncbi:hypothetical protein DCC79_05230 [bacterium]|nr:MAG: hypothetical protein DCC79_05230 [bacterium]